MTSEVNANLSYTINSSFHGSMKSASKLAKTKKSGAIKSAQNQDVFNFGAKESSLVFRKHNSNLDE